MSRDKAKFTAITGERVCRIDLDNMEIEAEGMEKEKCRKILRNLLGD